MTEFCKVCIDEIEKDKIYVQKKCKCNTVYLHYECEKILSKKIEYKNCTDCLCLYETITHNNILFPKTNCDNNDLVNFNNELCFIISNSIKNINHLNCFICNTSVPKIKKYLYM